MLNRRLFFKTDLVASEQKYIDAVYAKITHEKESGEIGYYVLPENQEDMVNEIYDFIRDHTMLKSGVVENLIVIGIGGSSLGAKAIDTMLSHLDSRNSINLQFLENCDPIFLNSVFSKLDGDKTMFIMISKSGSTIETTSVTKYIMGRYGLDFGGEKIKNQFMVITDPDSPLDQFATSQGIKAFHLPKNVGGRFSVLTAVGLVPLAIIGYDIRKLLAGAKAMGDQFFARQCDDLLQKAFVYARDAKEYGINVLFSYSSLLYHFNAWYVQLWGESLGKLDVRENNVGLTPVGLVGSVDQHSFLQLIVQGPKDKTVTFIKVKDFGFGTEIPNISIPNLEKTDYINGNQFAALINAQADATMETLVEQGVFCDLIEIDKIDEENVGMLLFYYELLTSCAGAFLSVNTYDQPGVEFGKVRLVQKFTGGN